MNKRTKTTYPKESKKQQHCPCCHAYITYIEGFGPYICPKCVTLATDKNGEPIHFKTITSDGKGIQGIYTETGKLYRSAICYIKGIKCKVEELTSGGMLNRPVKTRRT